MTSKQSYCGQTIPCKPWGSHCLLTQTKTGKAQSCLLSVGNAWMASSVSCVKFWAPWFVIWHPSEIALIVPSVGNWTNPLASVTQLNSKNGRNREGCLLSMPVFTQYDTFQRGLGRGLLPTVTTILWRRHHVWTWITVVFWREHVFSLVYLLITKKTCIFWSLAVLSRSGNLSCGENLTFPLLWPKTESVQLSGLYQNSWLNLPRATFKPRHMMTHLIWDRGQKHSVPLTALSGKTRQAALRAPARALSCSDTCQWCILHKQPALWRTRAFWKVLNLDWSLCYTSSQHWGRRQIKVFSQNLVKGRGCLRTML